MARGVKAKTAEPARRAQARPTGESEGKGGSREETRRGCQAVGDSGARSRPRGRDRARKSRSASSRRVAASAAYWSFPRARADVPQGTGGGGAAGRRTCGGSGATGRGLGRRCGVSREGARSRGSARPMPHRAGRASAATGAWRHRSAGHRRGDQAGRGRAGRDRRLLVDRSGNFRGLADELRRVSDLLARAPGGRCSR
jgi:hypothetical protein